MKNKIGLALLGLALIAGSAPANATVQQFDFTFTNTVLPGNGCCGPFDVSAILTATLVGTNYDVTGITGTVTEGSGSPGTYAITGLIPGSSDPLNLFTFDNVIHSTGGIAPFSLDSGGIAFYATAPSFYGETNVTPSLSLSAFNVWGNGGSSYTLGTTASYDVNSPFNGVATITAVPEASTWALMLLGFAGLGLAGYHKTKKTLAFAAA